MNSFEKLCNIINYRSLQAIRFSYNEWSRGEWSFRVDAHPNMSVGINTLLNDAIDECYSQVKEFPKTWLDALHKSEENDFHDLILKIIAHIKNDLNNECIFTLSYGDYLETGKWIFKVQVFNPKNLSISSLSDSFYDEKPVKSLKKYIEHHNL